MAFNAKKPSRYRGRHRHRKLWILLGALLLVLVFIGGTLLSDYMVFSSDGFHFGVRPGREDPPAPEGDYDPPEVIIDGRDPQPAKPAEPQPVTPVEPEPVTPTEPEPVAPVEPRPDIPADKDPARLRRLFSADIAQVTDPAYLDSVIAQAQAEGYDALVFTVKGGDGTLYLPCDSAYASDAAAVVPNADAIRRALLAASERIPLAARISVCRDGKAPRAAREQAVRTNGVSWLDYDYISWFNPFLSGVADYTEAVMESCKKAGFSSILLEHLHFPRRGKLELIDPYEGDTGDRSQAIEDLAQRLEDKAGQLELALTLLLDGKEMENAVTGQSVALLRTHFSTLYVPAGGDPAALGQQYEECVFGTQNSEGHFLPN